MKRLLIITSFFFMAHIHSEPLQFIPAHDPRLNESSAELSLKELSSSKIQNLIQEMLALSGYEANPSKTQKQARLVGLAAPQIGVMKQIIVIDANASPKGAPKFEVLINPKITWKSEQTEPLPQGCYSVPEKFKGMVVRAVAVEVEGLKPDGSSFQKRYEGYPSHVVQHEIDHLHGVRFPQRLTCQNEIHLLPNGDEDLPKYRKEWRNWPHHVSSETFEHLKEGRYDLLEDENSN